MDEAAEKKLHRERHAGRKAQKKKEKKISEHAEEPTDKQRNPKAFAFNSAVRAERKFRRKEDINTKKQHIPLVDRTPLEPPPILVAVVGPPKVGKSTLINNLIKLFTKSPLVEIKGPVTIVTGKKRRITFIECNNDINSMIDLAKAADLVLLLCDASFGFEMEVFEFLNICQVHGMPKIMGVLTHLDMIKNSKSLKNTKKVLKHRFWTEVYAGAKLFYLSGIIHEEYLRNEIKNLGRFISVMKFRPLTWRTTHGYVLADRFEDLTNQELIRQNPKCDRNISLYGYIRGVPIKKQSSLHIAGLGDVKIHDMSFLLDPCPLPEEIKKRALVEKEKLIYAPFSGVGGIVYDKDAVYVDLGGSHSYTHRNDNESIDIVTNLIETQNTLDVKIAQSKLQIFKGGQELTGSDFDNTTESNVLLYEKNKEMESTDDVELERELQELRGYLGGYREEKVIQSDRIRRKVHFEMNDEEFCDTFDDSGSDSTEDEDQIGCQNIINESSDVKKIDKTNKNVIHSKIKEVFKKLDEKKLKVYEVISDKINQNGEPVEDDEEVLIQGQEDDEDDISADKEDGYINFSDEKEDVRKEKEQSSASKDMDEDDDVKWKENLKQKALNSFLNRQSSTHNLMKLVYGVFDVKSKVYLEEEVTQNNIDVEEDVIGGLFKKVSDQQQKLKVDKDVMDLVETSLILPWNGANKCWLYPQRKADIENCFVTGRWKEYEDANHLLNLDDQKDLSDTEMFGDFEDFETGEKHTAELVKKRKNDEQIDNEGNRETLVEKKRKLKEKFDEEYDNTEKSTYYDELKQSAEKQAQLNKTIFDNISDDVRVEIEGFRPGMYVRIEMQNIPHEFVTNFEPTYPLLVGALNMGEENIGYVNVRIKKHRWYSKILKTCDPIIISLGWRRFQTIPIYSKLEDDLKFRYLKYTPEHLSCNAHFWGPLTPQGSGFLALQSIESNLELLKKQGFRIAATGVVQELDKSTQIMKKLKLVGCPMKIYKKTAFIKGMFNSALEVARFEGARIKTVSGIRGQIKKAVSKPEGCFRATFEDKIVLSDIVFCRTWYKVDVPLFYAPVSSLLLPEHEKNCWRGLRTVGEIKREKLIRNAANLDSLYTPIVRNSIPLKPLVIPTKLQKELPYRDKPKHGVKTANKKNGLDRVAVIREPHENKVMNLMKIIKTNYDHKQDKLKKETQERLEKHRQMIRMQESSKEKKIKQKKKDVLRMKSKAEKTKKNNL